MHRERTFYLQPVERLWFSYKSFALDRDCFDPTPASVNDQVDPAFPSRGSLSRGDAHDVDLSEVARRIHYLGPVRSSLWRNHEKPFCRVAVDPP